MYLSKSGNKLTSPIEKLIDTIKVNLDIDRNDVPFTNLGITRNFSKNGYSDTIEYIKLQISDMLKANNYTTLVSIKSISYNDNDNIFTINLVALGEEFKLSMNGG